MDERLLDLLFINSVILKYKYVHLRPTPYGNPENCIMCSLPISKSTFKRLSKEINHF